MSSASLLRWRTTRRDELDEIVTVHVSVGGTRHGRRYATQQINHAYVMLLSLQFQGFCRDLYSESVKAIVAPVASTPFAVVMRAELLRGTKLGTGNPKPGNIGADFGRIGINFWVQVVADSRRSQRRQAKLEALNRWRNAISHQDFDLNNLYPLRLFPISRYPTRPTATEVQLTQIRDWREACNGLAESFDRVLSAYITNITGSVPW